MSLPRDPKSRAALQGLCAVWMNEDTVCGRALGHYAKDSPHRGYDPSGTGSWIETDDDGRVLRRGGPGSGSGDVPRDTPRGGARARSRRKRR